MTGMASYQTVSQGVHVALKQINQARVLLLGDLLLDAYVYGETVRISREAPVLVVQKQSECFRLGGAANTAQNLSALGVQLHLLSALSEDAAGQNIKDQLSRLRADLQFIDVTTPTTIKTRIMAGAFGTLPQQVLRLDAQTLLSLSNKERQQLLERLYQQASEVDVIVVSDYELGLLDDALIAVLCELSQQGLLVCVDSRYRIKKFKGVSAITPNIPEAEYVVGYSLHSQQAVMRAGEELLERLHLQACLLTQGRAGMTLFRLGHSPQHIDVCGSDEVSDVTGAGDTVIATFAAAMAADLGWYNAMLLANCAAGIVVTKQGAATALPSEIIAAALINRLELEPWQLRLA